MLPIQQFLINLQLFLFVLEQFPICIVLKLFYLFLCYFLLIQQLFCPYHLLLYYLILLLLLLSPYFSFFYSLHHLGICCIFDYVFLSPHLYPCLPQLFIGVVQFLQLSQISLYLSPMLNIIHAVIVLLSTGCLVVIGVLKMRLQFLFLYALSPESQVFEFLFNIFNEFLFTCLYLLFHKTLQNRNIKNTLNCDIFNMINLYFLIYDSIQNYVILMKCLNFIILYLMDLKRTNSSKKRLNLSHSSFSLPKKNSTSKQKKQTKLQHDLTSFAHAKKKKQSSINLKKKKIQDLKTPELLIKVSYKGKKLSIPITNVDDKGISDTLLPHIIRFQKQILRNPQFNPSTIENWKTINSQDILKDYYLLTNKSLRPFKSQVLEVQPIWKKVKTDKIKLTDFQIIRCIGTGGFSRVYLARYLRTGKFYALKLMEKEGLLQSGKQCVVLNERDIMVELDNPHILGLQFAFQTKHFVVLALEYCIGGQLFYYLRKVKRMTEDEARYCFTEILIGIQYLHSKKIIYRDIKPENIMIDQDGNLKIADFGLSRKGLKPSQLAFTYCGSPEYMAPEMLSKAGHTFSVDYYCLGALLYELVTGNPPFYSRDVEKIYYSIQNQQIDFPSHIQLSGEIKMLLEGLLIKDPKRRLGSLGGIRQIMGHPWVRKIKITDVINKTIETHIKVDLLSWNINDDDIDDAGSDYAERIKDNESEFQEMFEGFHYNKNESMNIVQEAFPSIKSDSTKQNRNSTQKIRKEREKLNYKSQSREKLSDKFGISFKTETNHIKGHSEVRLRDKKGLKKNKSKKQLNLIERSRKRNEKSIVKEKKVRQQKRFQIPKNIGKMLKRNKSSTGLHDRSNYTHEK